MALIAFIGFGELGAALAERIAGSRSHDLCAWTREQSDPVASAALLARLARTGVERRRSLEAAIEGADGVLSVVPTTASLSVARRSSALLGKGALYVDLTAAPLADKQAGAQLVARAGGLYVDGAVLGAAAAGSEPMPILACGPGAHEWRRLARCDGLAVEVLDAPVGHATLLKLLRSVYMKGRDALIVETLLAARRYGLERELAASIQGPGERVPFSALSDRVLRSLAIHAERRADELQASSEVLLEAGVNPRLTSAGAQLLGEIALLGLRDAFAGQRPEDGAEVLALIDELLGESDTGKTAARRADGRGEREQSPTRLSGAAAAQGSERRRRSPAVDRRRDSDGEGRGSR